MGENQDAGRIDSKKVKEESREKDVVKSESKEIKQESSHSRHGHKSKKVRDELFQRNP